MQSCEGQYVVDRPVLVKCCLKCDRPVYYKESKKGLRLYCDNCQKFRSPKWLHWVSYDSNMLFVDKSQLKALLGIQLVI